MCDYTAPSLKPSNTRLCDAANKDVIGIRMKDTEKLGVAGFLTEW